MAPQQPRHLTRREAAPIKGLGGSQMEDASRERITEHSFIRCEVMLQRVLSVLP